MLILKDIATRNGDEIGYLFHLKARTIKEVALGARSFSRSEPR